MAPPTLGIGRVLPVSSGTVNDGLISNPFEPITTGSFRVAN